MELIVFLGNSYVCDFTLYNVMHLLVNQMENNEIKRVHIVNSSILK
jgi:pyrrolidone-carboxylate peptidase